jgi:electron transfer flavoprotein alpha subunit
MAYIQINQEKIDNIEKVIKLCPFAAIDNNNGEISINAACKMCNICIKKGPKGAFIFVEEEVVKIDKDEWKGIAVYADIEDGEIHPVTYELIGKSKEMASKINHPVYCLLQGNNIEEKANELLHWGVDEVFVYNKKELENFKIEPYTAVFEDFINKIKPSTILVGGTNVGRSLAPRTAARLRTGLTADCTILDIQKNTDLDQIRPAFGGNIMAHIRTPNHRPQFATVRYKIFNALERTEKPTGKITKLDIDSKKLKSKINILDIKKKKKEKSIEDAEVIIVAGRALKKEEDLNLIYELAELLEGQIATTRPLIEAGWSDPRNQIGLSGRTVKPKLIITCGVSGSVQFVAGMNSSETIVAINTDKNAPIFNVAHYALLGDIYEVVPKLIENIKAHKGLLGGAA